MVTMNGGPENYRTLMEKIASFGAACVAVTKHQPVQALESLVKWGHIDFGVNYVQQGEELRQVLVDPKLCWHYIGHIQSRKVRLLGGYNIVQSIDRMTVAEGLHILRPQQSLNVLVEVNIGEEPQKSGILPNELDHFLNAVSALKNLRIRGLMAMPPFLQPPQNRVVFFRALRRLFERYRSNEFSILSMGTSTDYQFALAEGSTMVRLGTALFGPRPKLLPGCHAQPG